MQLCLRCWNRLAFRSSSLLQWRDSSCHSRYSTTQGHDTQNAELSSDSNQPQWFQKVRLELINRKLPHLRDSINSHREEQLIHSIASFLPDDWKPILSSANGPEATRTIERFGTYAENDSGEIEKTRKPSSFERAAFASIGNHFLYCNARYPAHTLLPDGSDRFHSPGGPFVRRMWAGGSLTIDHLNFYKSFGHTMEEHELLCVEKIKDVQLRGQDNAAKIIVTVERRIGREVLLKEPTTREHARDDTISGVISRTNNELVDTMLVEERNLTFMHAMQHLDLASQNHHRPTKYLTSSATPDFSHTFTPNSSLLFRFSAMTFNAHAIHLDREYARHVEGHRNLLVHGPLTLMLLMKLVMSHLATLDCDPQAIQQVAYRNLAPLYCDESMRLCAREKSKQLNGDRVYDVWIEGPNGGIAVKGTIQSATVTNVLHQIMPTPFAEKDKESLSRETPVVKIPSSPPYTSQGTFRATGRLQKENNLVSPIPSAHIWTLKTSESPADGRRFESLANSITNCSLEVRHTRISKKLVRLVRFDEDPRVIKHHSARHRFFGRARPSSRSSPKSRKNPNEPRADEGRLQVGPDGFRTHDQLDSNRFDTNRKSQNASQLDLKPVSIVRLYFSKSDTKPKDQDLFARKGVRRKQQKKPLIRFIEGKPEYEIGSRMSYHRNFKELRDVPVVRLVSKW